MTAELVVNDYRRGLNVNQLMAKYNMTRQVVNDILLPFKEDIWLTYLETYDYHKVAALYDIHIKKIHSIVRGRRYADGATPFPYRQWAHTRWGFGSDAELISQIKYSLGNRDRIKQILNKNPHLKTHTDVKDLLYHHGFTTI